MERSRRVSVDIPSILIGVDGHECKVTIKDLSAQGFRVEHFDDLHPGDDVTLRMETGELARAQIVWSLGNEAGGVFLDPPPKL